MANMLMLGQMGLSLVGSATQFASQSIATKMQSAYQDYRNTMSALNAAQTKNAITLNEIAVRDASISEAADIETQSLRDKGAAEVAAASAGVKGNSVNLVMRELAGSAARANKNRIDNLTAQYTAQNQERRNVEVGQVMGKDVSVIPKVSAATALIGAGTSLLNIWDSHQTPGDSIAGRLSRI